MQVYYYQGDGSSSAPNPFSNATIAEVKENTVIIMLNANNDMFINEYLWYLLVLMQQATIDKQK